MDAENHGVKAKRKVHRSPNYPSLSLGDALDRARQIYDAEKRTPASPDTILAHLGYKPGVGPGLRALSALRQYGLLEERGGQDRISDSAFHILSLSEASPDRVVALREAARRPALFRQLLEVYGGEIPSDVNLRDHLIKVHSFNPDSVATFIKAFRETVEFAKLRRKEDHEASETEATDGSNEMDGRRESEQTAKPSAVISSGEASAKPSMQTVFLMRLKDGTVVELRASGNLEASAHATAIKGLVDMALGVDPNKP